MILISDLIHLTSTEYPKLPILDTPNAHSGLVRLFKAWGKDIVNEDINTENVHSWYSNNTDGGKWNDGAICDLRQPNVIEKLWSKDEALRILLGSPYSLDPSIDKFYDDDKTYQWVNKLMISTKKNGDNMDWNTMASFNNKCMSFNPFPDNENITFGMDITSWYANSFGKTRYSTTVVNGKEQSNFIDGEICFILQYKGKDAFIVSMDLCADGQIHIKQVQSLIHKRNKMRFLLGDNFFELIVSEFVRHFEDNDVSLITGIGMIKQIAIEGKDIKEVDIEAYNRIRTTYNQEFDSIVRGKKFLAYKFAHGDVQMCKVSLDTNSLSVA